MREADFYETGRLNCPNGPTTEAETDRDPGSKADSEVRTRWENDTIAFNMLKAKIAITPILKHFDLERSPVIVVYASKWAVSVALLQSCDGGY